MLREKAAAVALLNAAATGADVVTGAADVMTMTDVIVEARAGQSVTVAAHEVIVSVSVA